MAPFAWIGRRLGDLVGRSVGGRLARAGRTPPPTIPTPPQYDWAEALHAQQMAALATTGDIDLLLVGDSLAQHWPLGAWAPWRVVSLGIGGDGTQHVHWRVERITWGTCRPSRILVVAGTNNLLAADEPEDIADGIAVIAAKLAAAHPAAAVSALLPPPLGVGPPDGLARRRALRKRLGERIGRRLIDADAALGTVGHAPNPNYQADLIHFAERGYGVLTGVVRATYP